MKAFKGGRSASGDEHNSRSVASLDGTQRDAEVVGSGIVGFAPFGLLDGDWTSKRESKLGSNVFDLAGHELEWRGRETTVVPLSCVRKHMARAFAQRVNSRCKI